MPGAAQAVGQALGANPFPIVVPCHRVVAAHSLGGFSASGGARTKQRMLLIEGVPLQGELALEDPARHEAAPTRAMLRAAKARSGGCSQS
jgi:alkylated DNA nucleotide flippase Atl1